MTNLSLALSAAFSAVSKRRSSSRVACGWEAAPETFGCLAMHGVDLALGPGADVAAGAVDQPGGHALRVVEQGFQDVLGGELRVALAHRDGLRRLQKALRPLGVAFDLHASPREAARPAENARSARRSDSTDLR